MNKKGEIVFTKYGPYTVIDSEIYDENGKKYEIPRVVALCRCGGSKNMPFCDGTHGKEGFIGEREREGMGRTKCFEGKNIIIHDNRRICAHVGECKLENVFFPKEVPWINPDGSNDVEKIIEIIKQCPSGALTYTRDGQHITEWFEDQQKIIVEKGGPLRVQGKIELKDDLLSENLLISKDHYTLCRCGKSKNKPFCDGEHLKIKFKD